MLKFYESTTFAALRYLRFVVYANVGKASDTRLICIFMLSTLHLKPGGPDLELIPNIKKNQV